MKDNREMGIMADTQKTAETGNPKDVSVIEISVTAGTENAIVEDILTEQADGELESVDITDCSEAVNDQINKHKYGNFR